MNSVNLNFPSIIKQRRFQLLKKAIRWSNLEAAGFLGLFYGHALELNENGEISDWDKDYLAELIGIEDTRSELVWDALVTHHWIEVRDSRVFICDWIEIAGPALTQRYRFTDRQRLSNIWALHGQTYGRERTQKAAANPDNEADSEDDGKLTVSFSKPHSELSERDSHIDARAPATQASQRTSPKDNDNCSSSVSSFPSWETEGKEETAQTTRPAVKILQKLYFEKLAEKLGEKPVGFNWGAAGKIFKELLENNLGVQEIENRMTDWFKSTDAFIVKRGYRITDFPGYFSTLKNGPIANQVRNSNAREPFYDGAATVYEEAGADH